MVATSSSQIIILLFGDLAGATVTEVAISLDLGPLRTPQLNPTDTSRTEQELTLSAVCETRTCRPALTRGRSRNLQ